MRNIFILYMPSGNPEAIVHYEDTIRKKVDAERIYQYMDAPTNRILLKVFGSRRIAVWGSRDTRVNRVKFDRMCDGDCVLIVEGKVIKLLGYVACKTVNPRLSRELWQNLRGGSSRGWDLIYFIANPKEIDLPFVEFCRLLGYSENYQLRGFTTVSDDKREAFYTRYDDLYSILLRLKQGQTVQPKHAPVWDVPQVAQEVQDLPDTLLSDHVRMQWKLLSMGRKAGEKVWVPKNDQKKITSEFQFSEFEDTFAAGLDTQVKYVENIDVVWKEEYKIDAAFEIENSTSIYSGLLRFADLTMIAPNTLYPLFIVAPTERRQAVFEQLRRPSFRELKISDKVQYLSYESINEIDVFFENQGQGLNVDVLIGKAERLKD